MILRSNSTVFSNNATADSTDGVTALSDDLTKTIQHANVSTDDTVRQTRKSQLPFHYL